jgi:peptidoglycan/LPS O-acetylase OafA/YrhL
VSTEVKRLYFPALDGLRAFGFLLVFLHHLPSGPAPWLAFAQEHGWIGVHIFLFLSAYLLTAILQAEQAATGRISVVRFLIRRALRIWPLYFAFCGAMTIYMFAGGHYQPRELPHLIGLATFTENWVDGAYSSYSGVPYTSALWTISLEEQFYLILPWLLALWLAARTRKPLVIGLAVLWAIFVAARAIAVSKGLVHPWIWTSLFSADSLLLGTLLGAVRFTIRRPYVREVCFLAGLGVLATIGLFPRIDVIVWQQVPLFTVVAVGAAMLCVSSIESPALIALLGNRPMRYLGKISYGLYVYHVLMMELCKAQMAKFAIASWPLTALASLASTILVAAVSYALLEKPFLRIKRRFESVPTRVA